MHHLPAVTIYNKGGVGGVGVQFGQEWGARGTVSGWDERGVVAQRLQKG